MIADKCEMMIDEGEQGECDQVAVGATEDNVLVCEDCATSAENDGIKVDYFGDDC